MIDREKIIEFCKYVQPIVNSCAGFIKSNGYIIHYPGKIIMMSADEMCMSYIDIPVIHEVYLISIINTFLGLKTEEDQAQVLEKTYFLGSNIVHDNMMRKFDRLYYIDNNVNSIYYEPNCLSNERFVEAVSVTDIGNIFISNGVESFRVPVSKSITPVNKGDEVALKLYKSVEYTFDPLLFTARYILTKKKFKLTVNIFFNLLKV